MTNLECDLDWIQNSNLIKKQFIIVERFEPATVVLEYHYRYHSFRLITKINNIL
jgi:hypothetical protein